MADIIDQAIQIVKQSEQKPLTYEQYAEIIEPLRPRPGSGKWEAFWQTNMELSQRVRVYEIGVDYPRIPYGHESDWKAFNIIPPDTCHDCGVRLGMLHVPGCDVEQCPKCKWQAISCECNEE